MTERIVAEDAGTSPREVELAAALRRCAGGDRTALRLVYDRESPQMLGVARRMLRRRDLAEEAVQDTFVRIWRAAGTYDPGRGGARTWIYAILRNCTISILRDEDRFARAPADEPDTAPDADALAALPERQALRRCLDRLEPPRRSAIVLAYVHGLTHGELAGRLGVPLGTAKSWVRRGMAALQECMG
jgi:RNA polymerase sigma factor (sigma-70 family)